MSPEQVADVFVDELWNRRRMELVDQLFDATTVTHQLRSAPGDIPGAPRRPEDVKQELSGWFAGFPDLRFECEQRVTQGDLVVSRYVMRGTHTGPWLGIAPTGQHVTIRMVHTIRVGDGRILEDWLLADWHGMLQQLGLLPSLTEILAAART